MVSVYICICIYNMGSYTYSTFYINKNGFLKCSICVYHAHAETLTNFNELTHIIMPSHDHSMNRTSLSSVFLRARSSLDLVWAIRLRTPVLAGGVSLLD